MSHISDTEKTILALIHQVLDTYNTLKVQHPEEKEELIVGVHIIQTLIMRRVARSAEPKIFPIKE